MNILAELLKAKEPLFEHALIQLEKRTGQTGVDAALIGDIYAKAADAACNLGLDLDATGPQLYHALIQRVAADNQRLTKILGAKSAYDLDELSPLIVKKIQSLNLNKRGFGLKIHVADSMMRQLPPKAMMKRLGYPSVETLLAGEDIYELFIALRFSESEEWLNEFNKLYLNLKKEDFETRDIRLIQLDSTKWGDAAVGFIKKKFHNVTHSKEMAVIGLLPAGNHRITGAAMRVFPLVLHYFNEVRMYSAFFRLSAQRSKFGQVVSDTLIADTPKVKLISGSNIHWRVIQRYYGKLKIQNHPEIFEPHLQPEDLHWRAAEEVLFEIDPKMAFWRDLDYVAALKPEGTVTFNLVDVGLSFANNLGFSDRQLYHFRESLWNEVFTRYFGHKTLNKLVLEHLNNEMVKPERTPLP